MKKFHIESISVSYSFDRSSYSCGIKYTNGEEFKYKTYRSPDFLPNNVKEFMENANIHTHQTMNGRMCLEYFE